LTSCAALPLVSGTAAEAAPWTDDPGRVFDVRRFGAKGDGVTKVQGTPTFVLDDVDDFTVTTSRPVPDTRLDHTGHKEL
jgi:hypothetical protein